MKEQKRKRPELRETGRPAGEANVRLVELAQLLVRIVTLSPRNRCDCVSEAAGHHRRARGEPLPRDSSEQADAPDDPRTDEEMLSRLRELFHQDAWHRLAAARWIRQHRCSQAISVLEGVLSIEESDEVRGELERALNVLTAPRLSTEEI